MKNRPLADNEPKVEAVDASRLIRKRAIRVRQRSRGWKAWGDHPVVVTIGVIAGLLTIFSIIGQLFDGLTQAPVVASVVNDAPALVAAEASVVPTTPTPQPTATPLLLFNGTEWAAEYFGNENLSGEPVRRKDQAIDFQWDGQSPAHGIAFEHWSARWKTDLCLGDGPVTVYVKYDDGVRIFVDDNGIFDD